MLITAVVNRKGGVGKTTTAANLSHEFSKRGARVLLIDIDAQANVTRLVSGDAPHRHTIADVLENPKLDIRDAIHHSESFGIDYVPSTELLSRVQESLSGRFQREFILRKKLANLDYDRIIIDCPPDSGLGTTNALVAANKYLIPIDSGSFALDGLGNLLMLLAEVNEGRGGYSYAILRNEYSTAAKRMNAFVDEQLSSKSEQLLSTRIRRSETIQQAAACAVPVSTYAPGSIAAQDFKTLAQEVERYGI